MALAGVPADRLVALGWPDQEAALHLRELTDDLALRLAGCEVVLTHAYEGGHPDHDATAFAVRHAAERMGPGAPAIVEMPFYRAGGEGRLAQSFAPAPGGDETVIALGPDEVRLKERVFAAHATQREVLGWFSTATERFRPARRYDFRALPNGGALLYEQFGWGMTGVKWLAEVRRFYGSA
jgi:LmbE family N-acetylglucosaminyl deacetylase